MNENITKNEDKNKFWPSSKDFIWSKWPLMTREEKAVYICSILFGLSIFALIKSKVLNNLTHQEISIVMVIIWVIGLLLTIWGLKVMRVDWANTKFLRALSVVMMVIVFFFILGFYLQLY